MVGTLHLRLTLLVLFLLFAGIPCAAAEPAAGGQGVAGLIRAKLSAAEETGEKVICTEPLRCDRLLLETYAADGYRQKWTKIEQVQQLLVAISSSAQEGLSPLDYHYPTLVTLGRQMARAPEPSKIAEFDILLTDALLRLGHDKLYGKVDPRVIHTTWNLRDPLPMDYARTLLRALNEGNLPAALARLSPEHPGYDALKYALAWYTAIADSGGWPTIVSGKTLKPGMRDPRIEQLRRRLLVTGELKILGTDLQLFDDDLLRAVMEFQLRHHLETDGIVGKSTLAALNEPVTVKINRIRANLERARWVLHDLPQDFIIIDIAGFMLQYYHGGQLAWSTRVMVGQPYHQTPVFRSEIKYMVLNPTWTIPANIAKNETVPTILKNPDYLREEHLRIFTHDGREIPPSEINFRAYLGKRFPYTFRQDPGPEGALGRIKFIFPNPHDVYLHDTPSKSLFDQSRRAFSHGCIRVQNPLDLGRLLLANDVGNPTSQKQFDAILDRGKPAWITLKTPLPILLMYWTVQIQDGQIWFKPDLYQRDELVLKALDDVPPLSPFLSSANP